MVNFWCEKNARILYRSFSTNNVDDYFDFYFSHSDQYDRNFFLDNRLHGKKILSKILEILKASPFTKTT